MLIDGGPGSTEPKYTTEVQARVKFNLFYTLNRLSGSTLTSGSTPPANVMKKIDTLVLTHDDVDHKQGTSVVSFFTNVFERLPSLQELPLCLPPCTSYSSMWGFVEMT